MLQILRISIAATVCVCAIPAWSAECLSYKSPDYFEITEYLTLGPNTVETGTDEMMEVYDEFPCPAEEAKEVPEMMCFGYEIDGKIKPGVIFIPMKDGLATVITNTTPDHKAHIWKQNCQ